MKIFQTQVSIREFLAFIFIIVLIRGAEYYMFSQNILTIDQYRLSIQALITLIFFYLIALVIRNQNIMKLRPSRHTIMYKGDELESYVHKMHSEGKSIAEITIVSGLSVDEIQKILEKNEK